MAEWEVREEVIFLCEFVVKLTLSKYILLPTDKPEHAKTESHFFLCVVVVKGYVRLWVVFINITLGTKGVRNKELESQHVSSLKGAVCCTPSENTLLIGFRYLQNDLFNGITTRIMILFMREAIQALRQADNAFPALWQLMLCYKGR